MGIEDGEGESKLSASEKEKLAFKEYLKDAIPGDAKYQAFGDIHLRYELIHVLKDMAEILEEEKDLRDASGSINTLASDLLMLNQDDIEQKMVALPGYKEAYYKIDNALDDIYIATSKEIAKIQPDNEYYVKNETKSEVYNFVNFMEASLSQRHFPQTSEKYHDRAGGVAGG
jgi:hypothetical protein